MNTYRITITTTREPDQESRVLRFDVDALGSKTAIVDALDDFEVSFFERRFFKCDLETVTSQLYAENIFPLNAKTVRQVVA